MRRHSGNFLVAVTRNPAVFFGTIAFLQTMADPAEGLFSQPMLSLLRRQGRSLAATTDFAAIVSLPWAIKPFFGLFSDFLPFLGSRRKSYLVLSGAVTLIAFGNTYTCLGHPGSELALLGWLVLATAGVAFSDVVSDALMIEIGQPRGLTGRFQSIQWSSTYAATILVGSLGGWSSRLQAERLAMASCAMLAFLMMVVSILGVREPDREPGARPRRALRAELRIAVRQPRLWAAAGFLFLWNFNPFAFQVMRAYMTEQLGRGADFYGVTLSLFALACLVASLAYGTYCRRVPFEWLIHASIALGVLQTIAYWGLVGPRSALVVTIFAGLAYMTATLIQLDLAARICPPAIAGTTFALLMSAENLATTAGLWAGGRLYAGMGPIFGWHAAYRGLVAIGAATTAACWLLLPWLPVPSLTKGDREETRGD